MSARPPWIPDWSGCVAVIVACGPSASKADLSAATQKARVKIVAIKEAFNLCRGADMVYGCDGWWWKSRRGLPEYRGLKVAYERWLPEEFPDIKLVQIKLHDDKFLLDQPGTIGSGGNSGFQATNLCLQAGVRQIVLVGMDMHDRSGKHFYGRNEWHNANNPGLPNFDRWTRAFATAAPAVSNMGIDIVNATRFSEAKAFRMVPSVDVALSEWKV
jgi:hypothetical protein